MLITAADVRAIVASVGLDRLMDEMIEELATALASSPSDEADSPPRRGFQYDTPTAGLIEWMPFHERGDSVTVKMVGYHPSNPQHMGLPTVLATASVYDTASGHLVALADATFLTALRTGAASGVATRLLAAPEARVVGIIGCGAQAVSQLHALLRIMSVELVLVNDIAGERARTFPERIGAFASHDLEVAPVTLEVLLSEADVICTSTSLRAGEGPLFEDRNLKEWLHVNAVGSDFPGKCELPLSLLERSLVVPDYLPQAMSEGETQQLDPGRIEVTLADLVRNPDIAESHRRASTVFDSTGWALADHVGTKLLMRHAHTLGAHQTVALEAASGDPYAPYQWDAAVRLTDSGRTAG